MKTGNLVICAAAEGICPNMCEHNEPHKRRPSCELGCSRKVGGVPTAICVKVSPAKDVKQRRMM